MVFWLICAVMTVLAVAYMALPLLRPKELAADNPDVAVYRAQLSEIDKDLERGVLAADEAERARTEVSRRLLNAHRATDTAQIIQRPALLTALATALLVILTGFGTYFVIGAPGYPDLPLQERLQASADMRANRPAQATLESVAPPPPPVEMPEEYLNAVAQLRDIAPTRPDELQAWQMLAYHEAQLRNYAAAAVAQQRVIEIMGDAANVEDYQRRLDLMVVAAGGLVSPEAEALINQILDMAPSNIAARYYLGVLYNQTDRPDLAFRLWRPIVEDGDPADFHVSSTRAQIVDAAFRSGIEYALPETRGPSADQIAAASEMSEQDQQAMIGNMVAGLAERLANEGGPAQDWARLIRAYGVLGDTDAARAVWEEAQQVFATSMMGMDTLRNAARDAGVLE